LAGRGGIVQNREDYSVGLKTTADSHPLPCARVTIRGAFTPGGAYAAQSSVSGGHSHCSIRACVLSRWVHTADSIDAFGAGDTMPLVTCADCGKQISDAAPACIHCGRLMGGTSRPPPEATPQPESQRDNTAFRCPKCGSEDVRRLSVVHASGLSTTQRSSSVVGLGVSDDGELGLAGGVVSGGGTQETALARAAAPPTPMTISPFGAVIIGLLGGIFPAGPIITALVATASPEVQLWALLLGCVAIALPIGVAFYR
jgi:DNA-directed RNA polymerase subunit RPC12/RpoP